MYIDPDEVRRLSARHPSNFTLVYPEDVDVEAPAYRSLPHALVLDSLVQPLSGETMTFTLPIHTRYALPAEDGEPDFAVACLSSALSVAWSCPAVGTEVGLGCGETDCPEVKSAERCVRIPRGRFSHLRMVKGITAAVAWGGALVFSAVLWWRTRGAVVPGKAHGE
eukprot:RCo038594